MQELTLTGATLLKDGNGGGGDKTHNSSSTNATSASALQLTTAAAAAGAHSHSHSHNHAAGACCSHLQHPHASMMAALQQQPVSELVHQKEPQQVFLTLLQAVRMGGPFSLWEEIVTAWKNELAEQQQQQLGNSNNSNNSIIDVQQYLQKGRDAQGHSMLHWAAKRTDDVRFVQTLLHDYHMNVVETVSDDDAKMTALHWACTEPHALAVLRVLLEADPSSVQARDATACTPLLIAAQHGHVETCAYLLIHGAQLEAVDASRDSATHWAAYKGSLTVLGLLSYYDTQQLLTPDLYGQTPLHLAALRGHTSVCRYILQTVTSSKGGGKQQAYDLLRMTDKNGRTPYQLAVHKEKPTVASVLKRHMEQVEPVHVNRRTFWNHTQRAAVRNLRQLVSWQAWKQWLGLPAVDDVDESPQFPFYYVCLQYPLNAGFYLSVFWPVLNTAAGVLWDYMFFHVVQIMMLMLSGYCFYRTSQSNPGRLDGSFADIDTWRQLYKETLESYADYHVQNDKEQQQQQQQHGATNTLCHTCHIVRPPRSKHDRFTRSCVLLFDHHCPFVGNSVGLYNYKWFYLFLVTMTIYFTGHWILLVVYWYRQTDKSPWTSMLGIYLGAHILMAAGMFLYHTKLILVNLTTNEDINVARYGYFWESVGENAKRFRNPWNRGWWGNLVDRFAPSEQSYMLEEQKASLLLLNNNNSTNRRMMTSTTTSRSIGNDNVV